ncbi:MAG: ATP-binding protein [Woeseiaceae bacterium]
MTLLKLSEKERLSLAVEGAGDGVWDWNILTGEMPLSAHYEAMLDFDKGELEPSIDAWVKTVHPEDLPRAQSNLQEYLEGKINTYHIELRLLCKGGSYKWILCRGTVVERDNDSKPLRMIGIHSDITERKLMEQVLIDTRDEANRANRAKSEFLSSMSHELRTPMNAILGFGQLLELDDNLSDENKESVHEIIKAGDHLLKLIEQVLDLSKVESGHIDLSLEPVEVCPFINDCINLVRTLALKRAIQISHSGLKGIAVRADRTRLMQVLLNFLSNAIKYNREGGTVKIEAQTEGTDRLRILVTDTGKGIPACRLAELFQPFNRLDEETGGIEGTGIGLTITRHIIEFMGGSIGVKSEVGVGSTFWLELPVESMPELPLEQNEAISNSSTTSAETDTVQHTVLYIEDNPSNIKLVARLLGQLKHIHLLTAHTPELGIELAMTRQPELILLDINMPGMDGYKVLEILKAEASLNDIPVIALTAKTMTSDIKRGAAVGFHDYLTKPINVVNFFEVIEKALST